MVGENRNYLRKEECELLVKEIGSKYGYDFSDYSRPSLLRKINRIYTINRFECYTHFCSELLEKEQFFEHFLQEVTVNVTEMYRDPVFYQSLLRNVFPVLKKLPFIRIWHAGCSTGEEVYSTAILLKESGLLDRTRQYATDINSRVLAEARKGIYPSGLIESYSANYLAAGGKKSLDEYYKVFHKKAVMDEALKKNMTFAVHNLVSDQSFNEFHLIICRNVLIYFNKKLQDRVIKLFSDSLAPRGFIALGTKESIKFSSSDKFFKLLDKDQKIWKKIPGDFIT